MYSIAQINRSEVPAERPRRVGPGRIRGLLGAVLVALPLAVPAADLRLPAGFRIEVVAEGLTDARSLARAPDGTLFVGTRREGVVYAVQDRDGDGHYEARTLLDRGLVMPNGVAWLDGDLYVAEMQRIWRYPDVLRHLHAPKRELVTDALPAEKHHGWRYLRFDSAGRLYVSIGAPCNVCEASAFGPGEAFRTASIIRMERDGSNWETVATGVRNSVGLFVDADDRLWFTDNGRDWLGDDLPPGELNRADRSAADYGFPYCHGGRVPDPDFDDRPCESFVSPLQALGPHLSLIHISEPTRPY